MVMALIIVISSFSKEVHKGISQNSVRDFCFALDVTKSLTGITQETRWSRVRIQVVLNVCVHFRTVLLL